MARLQCRTNFHSERGNVWKLTCMLENLVGSTEKKLWLKCVFWSNICVWESIESLIKNFRMKEKTGYSALFDVYTASLSWNFWKNASSLKGPSLLWVSDWWWQRRRDGWYLGNVILRQQGQSLVPPQKSGIVSFMSYVQFIIQGKKKTNITQGYQVKLKIVQRFYLLCN